MCLILFAYHVHPDYSLVLAANRDEFYRRPTKPLDYWEDAPHILAGRDLEANGTWMGISRSGRLAALTNLRSSSPPDINAPSRGNLVKDFLLGQDSPGNYLKQVMETGKQYNGFNLLTGDQDSLCYYSNGDSKIHTFSPGIYGISTCVLGTSWPKISKGEEKLSRIISEKQEITAEALFMILQDREIPPDNLLPKTGIDQNRERVLAPLFIESEGYGTRCSSVMLINREGKVSFSERTFVPHTKPLQYETKSFEFTIKSA